MFPVRHCSYSKKILKLIPVGTGGARNWCRTVCFWSVVMATIFRKPGVCLSASWNHSLLNSFVPEEPLGSQLLHTRLVSSHWFPGSCHSISHCPFTEAILLAIWLCLGPFSSPCSSYESSLLWPVFYPEPRVGTTWPCLPFCSSPHLAHSRHLINAWGISPWVRNGEHCLSLGRVPDFLVVVSPHHGWAGSRLMKRWKNRMWPVW